MTDAPHQSAEAESMTHHPLLADLTDAQRQAVTTTEGPLLVVAAAGSGKTRVITRRVAWLVKQIGIAPSQVLAITFTNKAAGEMRDRVATLVSERQARALTICTFHALCARLLREFADRAGIKPDFSIYDTDDQKRAVKQAVKDQQINEKNFTPDAMLSAISSAKNELVDEDIFTAQAADFFSRIVAKVYQRYQHILRANNALDFDDLLTEVAFLLGRDQQVRLELQDRYQYLLIDEYQDTNHAQFTIANHIAARHTNICVVGDPDQSIYGWRGANIRNILEFEQHYPGAKVVELGRNYRSTPQILHVADSLIRNNKKRRHKKLFTENPPGDKIRLVACADEEHEAQTVVDFFREQHDTGRPWSDMVVFYRINSLSRMIEETLMRSSIPYQVVRGTAFYQRKEIRDAVAYLRVLNNPADEIAILRIINQPTRGIGDTTVEHLRNFAAAKGLSLWGAIEQAANVPALNPRAVNAVRGFAGLYRKWREKLDTADQSLAFTPGIRDLVEMVIRDSDLEKHYKNEDPDGEKVANLYELVSAAQRFDDEYETENADLPRRLFDYLESIALVADIDGLKSADSGDGLVTLMTLHAAKGLEFPIVAMIGLEEGLLPHSRSFDQPAELEEERRLCFVGITRAMHKLHLTHARYRTIRGLKERAIPSQFIRELPEDVIDHQDLDGAFHNGFDEDDDAGPMSWQRRRPRSHESSIQMGRGTADLPAGCLVVHPQFGQGRILAVTGAGPNARAKVNFGQLGVKTLILEYAHLERVDMD
jgi:ATP-dependent DNA helicase UvrD/PcrA